MRTGIFGVIGGKDGASFSCTPPVTSVEQHAFFETDSAVFALHGLWLNSEIKNWSKTSSKELETFASSANSFNSIDGPVQAFHFNTQTHELSLHVDFARQQTIFYYHDGNFFAFAPQMEQLSDLLKQNELTTSADPEAAALLLSFASIPGDRTLIQGVRKLMPGHSLKFKNGKVEILDRNNLSQITRDLKNLDDAIDLVANEFSKSTQQMCDTNTHLSTTQLNLLSGGIDSRMVFFETKNYTDDIHTLCFSAKDYIDNKVSQKISNDYRASYHFYDLQQGQYMLNTSSALQYDGTISYLASSHHREVIDTFNLENIGVVAGGAFGNELLSEDFYKPQASKASTLNSITTNQEFRRYCSDSTDTAWNENPESGIFKLTNRGFLYTNSGSYSTHPHGVLHSPFTSQEFVKAALSLHPDLLHDHHLYLEWMKRYHPEATNYTWERYRTKPIRGFGLNTSKLKMKLLEKFIFPLTNFKGASMSPVQHWYNSSEKVQHLYTSTFDSKKHLLQTHLPELAHAIISSFKTMNITNKASVLTLLIALDKYLD